MIELHHTDCMSYMRGLPDKAFDLAIVDPPYGIDYLHTGGRGTNCKIRSHNRKDYIRKTWDKSTPGAEYFGELFRCSEDQIIWGANYFSEHLPPSMGWMFWDKGQRGLTMSDGELAYTSFKKALRVAEYNRCEVSSYGGAIHPTQKPVALYRWLLQNYAKPGQRILDTHLGSGSIAIACDLEGFDLVGCEIDADYIAGARKRLADHQAQPRLFDAPKPTSEQLSAL